MNALSPTKTTLRIANVIGDVEKVVLFVEAYGREHALPSHAVNNLNLCLDEILSNTISYGYGGEATGRVISVSLSLDGPYLAAEVEDDAGPFDPRRSTPPDLPRDRASRKPGGLGLYFVNSLMDVIDYQRTAEYNRTTLKISLQQPGASKRGAE